MMKVKVQWTIEVTETYEIEIDFEDFEDFQGMFDEGTAPTLEEFTAGQYDIGELNAEELAGSEDHETTLKYSSVDERYVDDITVIEA